MSPVGETQSPSITMLHAEDLPGETTEVIFFFFSKIQEDIFPKKSVIFVYYEVATSLPEYLKIDHKNTQGHIK